MMIKDFRRFDEVKYVGGRLDLRKVLGNTKGTVDRQIDSGRVVCAFPKGRNDDGDDRGQHGLILSPSDLCLV